MKNTTKLSVLAAAAAVAATGAATEAQAKEKEKCYGVSKAGKNACAANGHACAGQAKTDGDAAEWVYTPKGLCDKLAGGSTEKPAK